MSKLTTAQIRQRASELISTGITSHSDLVNIIKSESPETPENTIRTQVYKARSLHSLTGTRTVTSPLAITPELPPARTETLIELGFELIGNCSKLESGFTCQIDGHGHKSPAIYAFVVDGMVMYIGKTRQSLDRRFHFYAKPGPRQSTNIRVNANVLALHGEGKEVEIYALTEWEYLEHRGIPINVAAGIEDELINRLRPPWNSR